MLDIGLEIKKRREEKGLSLTQLALAIGRSPQMICDIEAGRKKPSLSTLIALAKALDLSLDNIFLK